MITLFPTYAILPVRSNQREKGRMSKSTELMLLQRVQAGDERTEA